jgi:hypothetical protein
MDARPQDKARRQGLLSEVEAALRRTLQRPKSKETLRSLLSRFDPENARALVRTALWTEPELFLSAVGAMPQVLNALIHGADEALDQIEEKMRGHMRGELVGSLIEDLDLETLGEVTRKARRLWRELSPRLDGVRQSINDQVPPEREV